MTQARSLPFIMGQTMVLRRRALEAAGGLGASAGQLVDDMDIGARLAHAGFRNVLIGAPIAIRSEGMTWAAFRALALRWMIYSRTGIPLWPFGMPAMVLMLAFHVAVIAAIIAGWLGTVIGATLFTLAALAEPVALQALRRRQGAAPVPLRLVWAIPLVLWLIPLFFVQALFARSVEWRGRRYTLGPGGRLRGVRPPTTRGVSAARGAR
jgi:ceramide glucosyltransferase